MVLSSFEFAAMATTVCLRTLITKSAQWVVIRLWDYPIHREKSNRHGPSDREREIHADTHNDCVTVSMTCVRTTCVCACECNVNRSKKKKNNKQKITPIIYSCLPTITRPPLVDRESIAWDGSAFPLGICWKVIPLENFDLFNIRKALDNGTLTDFNHKPIMSH